MATCVDAGTILQQLTSEMMSVGATNFDRRPDLKSSLFMLGVLSSDLKDPAEVLVDSNRGTVNSARASLWFMDDPTYQHGLAVGKFMDKDMDPSMAGGRKGRKGRKGHKQRGGRSQGFKRALAWMVAVSFLAAMYFGQAAAFSRAFKMDTTLSGLQSMLNGYLISKGVLYGRCASFMSVGGRSALSFFSAGNVWSCSQFAAADEQTMTAIYGVLAASGYSAAWATGGARAHMERLVDAVDYIMFEGMPHLGSQVVDNARVAAHRAQEVAGHISGAARRMFERAPAAASCPANEAQVVAGVNHDLEEVAEIPAAPGAQNKNEVVDQVRHILGDMVESVASEAERLRDEAAANDEEMKDADYGGGRRRRRSNKRKMSGKRRTKRAAPKRKTRKGKKGKGKKRSTRRR